VQCKKAINTPEKLLIQSVKADITYLHIVFKEGVSANFDELRKTVEDAGFSVARLRVTGQFKNLSSRMTRMCSRGQDVPFSECAWSNLDGEKSIVLVIRHL
jgi:hypothetical protein